MAFTNVWQTSGTNMAFGFSQAQDDVQEPTAPNGSTITTGKLQMLGMASFEYH
jgi:hypothetical protein